MESLFLEIIKASPIMGVILLSWFFQRKDYRDFVEQVQKDNNEREKNYQSIISKLTDKFNIVEEVKKNVEEIKIHIFNR